MAVQSGLVARRLRQKRFPLFESGKGYSATIVPDAGALSERGMPLVGRIALRPLYAVCAGPWW